MDALCRAPTSGCNATVRAQQQPTAAVRDNFKEFLATRGTTAPKPEDRERLFQEFLTWSQARERK